MGVNTKKVDSIFSKKEITGMFDGPILKVLRKLALPIFLGMIFQVLYSVVDTIWISRIDLTDPSYVGGVGMIFPLIFLVIALGSGLLIGVSSLVARAIGEKNQYVLNRTAESGLIIGSFFAVSLLILGYIFDEELIKLLGAKGDYYLHALEYFRFMIPAGVLMLLGNVFNGILQGEGLMKKIMVSMIIATVANMALDPVFIFLLGMGVRGAGLATVLSQVIAAVYVLNIFFKKNTLVQIEWKLKNISLGIIKKIVGVGFPQTAGQMTMAVSFLFFNRIVVGIDPLALTAFSLCGRLDMILIMPILAIGSSLITMIGQNYGRRNYERVKDIWRACLLTAVVVLLFLASIMVIFAPQVYQFFSDVDKVVEYAALQTRIVEFSFVLAAVAILGRANFQALGKPIPGLIIVVLRIAGVAIPMVYFYVYVLNLGIYGVWFGIMSGNAASAVVSLIWVNRKLKSLLSFERPEKPLSVELMEDLAVD